MKVNTNLSPAELDLVGKGLRELANRQLPGYQTESKQEEAIIAEAVALFDTVLNDMLMKLVEDELDGM